MADSRPPLTANLELARWLSLIDKNGTDAQWLAGLDLTAALAGQHQLTARELRPLRRNGCHLFHIAGDHGRVQILEILKAHKVTCSTCARRGKPHPTFFFLTPSATLHTADA